MSADLRAKFQEFLDKNYPCKCEANDPDCTKNGPEADALISMVQEAGYVQLNDTTLHRTVEQVANNRYGKGRWEGRPGFIIDTIAEVKGVFKAVEEGLK